MEAEQPESPSGCHSVAYQYRRRVRVSRKLICFRKFSKFIFHIASECCARGKPFLNKQEFELISLELMISEETTTTTTTTRTSASTRRQRNGEDGSPPRLPRPGPRPGFVRKKGGTGKCTKTLAKKKIIQLRQRQLGWQAGRAGTENEKARWVALWSEYPEGFQSPNRLRHATTTTTTTRTMKLRAPFRQELCNGSNGQVAAWHLRHDGRRNLKALFLTAMAASGTHRAGSRGWRWRASSERYMDGRST